MGSRGKIKNLEADNKLFFFINIEIVELVKLLVENTNKPGLEVGGRRRRRWLWMWKLVLKKMKMKIDWVGVSVRGGGG